MFQKSKLFLTLICLLFANLNAVSDVQAGSTQVALKQTQVSQTVSIQATKAEQQAALAKWTREARAEAKPITFPTSSLSDVRVHNEIMQIEEKELSTATVGSTTSGMPNPRASLVAQREFPEEWKILSNEADAATTDEATSEAADKTLFLPLIQQGTEDVQTAAVNGTAGIYTSYVGNLFTPYMHMSYPYLAIGKLYINDGGYCSASVISPSNKIVTAAHCVYNTEKNTWYSGWTFVPADRNNSDTNNPNPSSSIAPYGLFPWVSATVLTGWINAKDGVAGRRYDIAVISLGNNSAGRSVTYYTGWLGRSWNANDKQLFHAIGYPGNLNDGRYTYICIAESFKQSTDILGMGCNMMHGSSGGPWIQMFTPYTAGSLNYVNSVVSGGLSGTTWGNTFYGARFTTSNIVSLCNSEGC